MVHSKLSTSSISEFIEDERLNTPKVPRGKKSDLTDKDLEEFIHSFASLFSMEDVE
jgi:hypothetical protein